MLLDIVVCKVFELGVLFQILLRINLVPSFAVVNVLDKVNIFLTKVKGAPLMAFKVEVRLIKHLLLDFFSLIIHFFIEFGGEIGDLLRILADSLFLNLIFLLSKHFQCHVLLDLFLFVVLLQLLNVFDHHSLEFLLFQLVLFILRIPAL